MSPIVTIDRKSLLSHLRSLEWRGGTWYGKEWVPACPACGGVKPGDWNIPWEPRGHKPDCRLRSLIFMLETGVDTVEPWC